ncbi:MAG: hypothetical protein IKO36_10130 [Bacteroidaceae bacterium]|nr:hypothetical protein [Bacteroidaceae bacterium]
MTREEAIQKIENRWGIMGYCESDALGEALDMAIEALQDEAVQGWIPCSERLPSNDGCVLVTIDDGIEFGKYEGGSWSIWVCEHWDKWDAKGTIAWMPLPEPWKGEENG